VEDSHFFDTRACATWVVVALTGLFGMPAMAQSGPEPDAPLPIAIELGKARNFNGFFLEEFEAASSDVQGRLAAGGDVAIDNYSIGNRLQDSASNASLLVGGDLTFPSGRVFQGDIVVAGSAAGVGDAVVNGLDENQALIDNAGLPFDFGRQFEIIRRTSRVLAAQPANGTFEYRFGGLHLAGDCASPVQIFQLDGQQVLDAHTFEVECIPDGATVIFNIGGTAAGLSNMSLESLAPHRERVLFNFFEAGELTLAGIGVQGSILAPHADIQQPQGVVHGNVIAVSWSGMMQLNHVPFRGFGVGDFCPLYPIALPFDTLEGAESNTVFEQLPRGTGAGNFSWLTWSGDPSAAVLANSLVAPGDSFIYINPDDDSDWRLTPNDWAQGAPGAMNSRAIRDNLDALLGTEITVPVWSEIRGQGNNLDYRVADFARVQLLDYRLPGNGWFTFEFLGFSNCYNRAPEALGQQLETEAGEALEIELTGADPDEDELRFEIVTAPQHGMLEGEPPLIRYVAEAGFEGGDDFEFIAVDNYLASAPAVVTIQVVRTNLPPQAAPLALDTLRGQPVAVELTATDPDGDPLSFEVITPPANGTVVGMPPLLSYQPNPDFVGVDQFEYIANDGNLDSASASVIIAVNQPNQPPVIVSEAPRLALQDTIYTYLAEAVDPDVGDTISWSLQRSPEGMAVGPSTGQIEWIPSVDYADNHPGINSACFVSGNQIAGQAGAADVVVVADESGSMREEHDWIPGFVQALESHLQANDVGTGILANRYGLIGYTSAPRSFTVGSNLLGDFEELMRASEDLRTAGGTEDGWQAIRAALDYPLRTGVATNIVLITDEGRDNVDSSITLASLQNELQDSGAVLNAVVNARFECTNVIGDTLQPLGLNKDGIGFLADGSGGVVTCSDAIAVSGSTNTISAYVDLALATGGAAWDLNFLRAGGNDAISFANALIDIKVREILDQLPPEPRADLSVDQLYLQSDEIRVEIINRGMAEASESLLQIFNGQQLQSEQTVPQLAPEERHVAFAPADVGQNSAPVFRAVLVPGDPGKECNFGNHIAISPVVTLQATDSGGLSDEQTFSISVQQDSVAPEFVSTPVTTASVGARYEYQSRATDPNAGDALVYSLVSGPDGMTIDPFSGDVSFQPDGSQEGLHIVVLRAIDLDGLIAEQQFELTIDSLFESPRFISAPHLRAIVGEEYSYQPQVDADSMANLEYDLVIAPPGLGIDLATGLVHWSVPEGVAGSRFPVSIRVRDQFGNFDLQIFELFGDIPNEAPRITTTPRSTIDVGRTYSYNARVQDPNFYEQHVWSSLSGPEGIEIDSESGLVIWPDENVAVGSPEGIRANNPFCLVRTNSESELDGREVWRSDRSEGVTDFAQPLSVPLFEEEASSTGGLENLQLVVGVALIRGGPSATTGLHALDLDSGNFLWTYDEHRPDFGISPAASDLDGNGISDIIFVDEERRLVSVDALGQFNWESSQPVAVPNAVMNESSIVIADLDIDGQPEIIIGSTVFGSDGILRWEFPDAGLWIGSAFQATPFVGDLTDDSGLEVAFFDEVRDAHGNLLWKLPLQDSDNLVRAHLSAGDIDRDGNMDLVASLRFSTGTSLMAISGEGQLIWDQRSDSTRNASSLLIADFTRNGRNEIFLPGNATLFNDAGETLWQNTSDVSLRELRTAIAADMSGDGWLEIIFHSGNRVKVLSGMHGVVLESYEWLERSNRVGIVPVLIHPEDFELPRLVLGGRSGILAMEPAWGIWSTSADAFKQVEYSQTPLRNESLRILQTPVRDITNTTFLTDIHITSPYVVEEVDGKRLLTTVRNRGTAPLNGGLRLTVYRGDPRTSGVMLRERLIDDALFPGQSIVFVIDDLSTGDLDGEIFALAEPQDTTVPECESGNNLASGVTAAIRVVDHVGASDEQFWGIGVRERSLAPTITSSPPIEAIENEPYLYQIVATDGNLGDEVEYRLTVGPKEARLHPRTGELNWTPQWGEVGEFQFRLDVFDLNGLARSQSFTVNVAESNVLNQPPVIHSQPVTQVQLGERYQYQVRAEDPDGQQVVFELVEAPQGMTIHTRTGLVTWDPLASEDALVTLQVQDERGAVAEQSFTIRVDLNPNQPPQIISAPPLAVNLGETWSYAVGAFDPDSDPVELLLIIAPDGALLDNGGIAIWEPTTNQLGEQEFVIEARDGRGGVARQEFTVLVNDLATNQPPQISSMPPTSATVGEEMIYAVQASDPDGDTLAFALGDQPAGAGIDPSSGNLSWTPNADQTGEHAFDVRVTDGNGGLALQRFMVSVQPVAAENRPPEIVSTPPFGAKTGREYAYDMAVVDPDGDALTFLLAEGPDGMSIDGVTGQLRWTAEQIGSVSVRVEVGDGEFIVFQQWQIDVLDGTVPLSLDLAVNPEFPEIGQFVEIQLLPEAASGQVAAEVTVNGQSVPVDPDLIARFVPTVAGEHTVLATIDDGFEQATAEGTFFASDPGAGDGPAVTLLSPDFDAEITAPVQVRGAVQGDGLVRWVLAYTEAGTQDWIFLAEGTDAFDPTDIARFDPSLLLNGQYRIALQAWDDQGRSGVDSRTVRVTGDMKVGHFSITFEDLSIPVSGIPITVTRTYDTRQRHQPLDFGHGWSIDYQNVQVQESRRLGLGWDIVEFRSGPFGAFFEFCVLPQGEPLVTVTLPDGSVETFEVHVKNECNDFIPVIDFLEFDFQPIDGTLSTLTENDFSGSMRLVNGNLVENSTFSIVADPTNYTLTTKDGFVFELDQNFGIRTVTDPNDNTLTYTDDGILHSSGKSVLFNRDLNGRITDIVDPMGNVLSYTYDGAGDLVEMTDQAAATTEFTYNSNHGLLDIIDPLGRRLVRNIYDEDGRLIAQEDNVGNRTEFDHDLIDGQSFVTDRLGRITFLEYDDRGNVTTRIDPMGGITRFTFDADDNQLTQTDPLGNTTTATYNDRRDQLTQTDPLGNTIAFSYNTLGQETSVTDARGNVYVNTYDTFGNLLGVEDPLGNITAQNINASGLVSLRRDAEGNETTFTYDDDGNVLTETDALGNVTAFTYDDNGNTLTEARTRTLTDGTEVTEITRFEYDARNRLIKTTDALGNVTETEYDLLGRETARIDALGRRTEMAYDVFGRLIETRYPDGTVETREYDVEGNLVAETDRLGRTTRHVYDALDRQVETILPDATPADDSDNPRTRTEYDAAGRVTAEIDGLSLPRTGSGGNRTEHEYDAAGQRIKTTDALGNVTQFEYDADGNQTRTIDAKGNPTRHIYDALGRRIETILPDATPADDSDNLRTRTEYDALERVTAEIDEAGNRTEFGYDALGRLITVTDALGNVTEFEYDEQGNRIAQIDAEGRVTRWEYDALGRTLARILPLGQREEMSFDANGNLERITDFNGTTIAHQYDVNDRLIARTFPSDAPESITYDAVGNRTATTDGEGTKTYAWDERNRLIRETLPDGTVLGYDYDAAGNRTRLVLDLASGSVQETLFDYDGLNRLAQVADPAGGITQYSYDLNGNRASIDNPNGTRTEYTYNPHNQLTALSTTDSGDQTVVGYTYDLHPTGRRLGVTEHSGRTTQYSFDTAYRLLSETITDPVNGDYSAGYTYDQVGNRTQSTIDGVQTAYTYDENDRLVQQGGERYTYDPNGNTLRVEIDADETTYQYDDRNRMVASTSSAAGVTTSSSYRYDIDGNRVQQTIDGETTDYTVDRNRDFAQVIRESSPSRDIAYTHGDDLISQHNTAGTFYYHYDGLGSTRALTDSTEAVTDTYDYEAFGDLLNQTGLTENNYRFTGEQYDPNLDQYYLRARYYNQNVGRFTQMDTFQGVASNPVTLHKYLYASADPVNNIDPSGNFSITSFSQAQRVQAQLQVNATAILAGIGISLITFRQLSDLDLKPKRASNRISLGVAKIKVRMCQKSGEANCNAGIPVLVLGADNPENTRHVFDAQFEMGLTPILNKTVERDSFKPSQKPECKGRTFVGSGLDCDEYPFGSTLQGGLLNYKAGRVSLRPISTSDNRSAGSKLRQFYGECDVKSFDPIRSTFGVIPVPSAPSTKFICPRP